MELNAIVREKASCPQNDLPAILGPEMAPPISWAPGKLRSFCRRKPPCHRTPRFRGGVRFLGKEWRFNFYGREDSDY